MRCWAAVPLTAPYPLDKAACICYVYSIKAMIGKSSAVQTPQRPAKLRATCARRVNEHRELQTEPWRALLPPVRRRSSVKGAALRSERARDRAMAW